LRRRAEEVGEGLPGIPADRVLTELLPQVRDTARIAAVNGRVRVLLGVEVVVVQAMDDAIRAHRNRAGHAEEAAQPVVQGAIREQPVVGWFVREDEERVLLDADDDDRQQQPGAGPYPYAEGDRQRDDPEGLRDRRRRARIVEASQWRELLGREKPARRRVARAGRARRDWPQILAELLARTACGMHIGSGQPDQLLAEVASLQQTEKSLGRRLDPFGDCLPVLELAGRDEGAELLQRLGPDIHVLADDEAFDRQARLEDELRLLQRNRLAVVAANHAAQGDAAERIHARQGRVAHDATDVLEAAVDAVGRRFLERLVKRLRVAVRLVIDAGIEAELLRDIPALVDTAGDADRAAAARLRELAHGTANGAARGADDKGLSGLRLADLHEAVPGRDAGHADGAEVGRKRNV